jgi:hypothetical protein
MGASEGQLFPFEGIGGEVACMVALRCVGGKEVGAIHDGQQSRAGSARTIGKNSAGNGYQIGPRDSALIVLLTEQSKVCTVPLRDVRLAGAQVPPDLPGAA